MAASLPFPAELLALQDPNSFVRTTPYATIDQHANFPY
jgi:hypothetical protein